MVVVAVSLLLQNTPYINIIVNSEVGFAIIVVVWCFLFSPDFKKVILLALVLLVVSIFLTFFELTTTVEKIGDFFYGLLVFTFFTFLRGLWEKTKKEKR